MTESLAYLFDPNTDAIDKETDDPLYQAGKASYPDVTGLFRLDGAGYFYFDADKSFAELNIQDGDAPKQNHYIQSGDASTQADSDDGSSGNHITLYNKPWVALGVNSGIASKGQFFPFNDWSDLFHLDADGQPVQNHNYFYYQNLPGREQMNHYFGMTIETEFTQPINGKIHHGTDDMTFEFSGDDDVWIFIDDVLVCDIGGMHTAIKAEINFATGIVTVGDKEPTTLLDIFRNTADFDAKNFSGSSFAGGTSHTLKFFYLERGNNISNASIRFNFQDIQPDVISKVDENGKPMGNVKFELYPAELTDDTNPNICASYEKTRSDPIITITTRDDGSAEFLDENGKPVDFSDHTFYILQESTPEGYRSNKDIILRFDKKDDTTGTGTNTFTVVNKYETGAYASFSTYFVQLGDVVQLAVRDSKGNIVMDTANCIPDDDTKSDYDESKIKEREKQLQEGLTFILPTVKDDTYGWLPLYGSNAEGWKKLNLTEAGFDNLNNTDDYMLALLTAAFYQLAEDGAADLFMRWDRETGNLIANLEDLPGNATLYTGNEGTKLSQATLFVPRSVLEVIGLYPEEDTSYPDDYALLDALKEKLAHKASAAADYLMEAKAALQTIRSKYSDLKSKESSLGTISTLKLLYTDKFERTYRSIIHIINQHQKLIVRKVDENGEPLSGAVFGLYDIAANAANGGTDYLISGKTDNSGLLTLNFSDIKAGVSDGQYWLREITAPSGYESNSELIEVIVENSHIFVNASAYSYENGTLTLKKSDGENAEDDHVKVYTAVGSLAHNVVRFTHTVIFDDFKLDTIAGEKNTAPASPNGSGIKSEWRPDIPFDLFFNSDIEYSMLDYAALLNYNPDDNKVIDTDTEQEAEEKIRLKLDSLGVIVTDEGFAYIKPVLKQQNGSAAIDLSSMFSMLNIVEVTNVSNGEPIKKEISPGEDKPVMPGQHITYDIKWDNCYSGKQAPAILTFTDELDPNVDFVSARYGDAVELKAEYDEDGKIINGSAANTDGTVTISYEDDGEKRTVIWIIKDVPFKQEETVRLTVKVSDRVKDVNSSDGVYVKNHAVVYNSNESNEPDGSDEPEQPPHGTEEVENPVAYFNIEKKQSVNDGLITTDPLSVRAGDKVTYYLYVSVKGNPGTKLEGVVVQDKVPEGLTLDTNSEITSQKSGTRISVFNKDPVTIEWRLGSVPVGDDPIILSYTVIVPPVTDSRSWRNTAYAISGVDDNTSVLCPDEIPDGEEPSSWTPSNTVLIEEQVGKLQISKLIQKQGNNFLLAIDEQAEFTFTVVLYDGSPNNPLTGTYGYSYSDENGNKCDKDGKPVNENMYTLKSGDTVTLKHGQSILIEGLPAGITYLVTEKDSKAGGYNTADAEGVDKTATGVIVNGKAADGTEQISQAKFVNIYSPDGKLRLTVNKEIVGRDWINGTDTFTFELTVDPTDDYTKKAIAAGKITMPIPDSSGKYTVTVNTKQEAYAVIDAIKFNDISETDANKNPKPYKFIVKETKPAGASGEVIGGDTVYNHLVYDEKTYVVYVTVTEPAQKNGELQVYASYTVSNNTVESASGTESGKYDIAMTFANTYKPTPAEANFSLEVIKTLTGRDWTNTDKFKFDLKLTGYYSYVDQQEVDNTLTALENKTEYITENGSSPSISKGSQWIDDTSYKGYILSKITFKKAGKFVFSVTEDDAEPINGISYSDRKYIITVKVEDISGMLTVTDVTVNISGSSGEDHKVLPDNKNTYSTTLSFTNTYSAAADVTVPIKKVLEGWGDEQFKFTLTPVPTETVTAEEISSHVAITPENITLSANNDSGSFVLKFTSNGSDTSSYSFIIAEEKNSEYKNIIFAEPYKMTVDLKDENKDGTMSYTVSYFDKEGNPLELDGPLTFVNEYSAPPQNNPDPPQNDPKPPQNDPDPPQNDPDPPQNEPSPKPPAGDDSFNLDDDGIPRGDENLRDPNFNLGDDGLPKGDLNLPTGVPFGSSAYFAVGTLLLVAAAVTVGKLFHSKKNK